MLRTSGVFDISTSGIFDICTSEPPFTFPMFSTVAPPDLRSFDALDPLWFSWWKPSLPPPTHPLSSLDYSGSRMNTLHDHPHCQISLQFLSDNSNNMFPTRFSDPELLCMIPPDIQTSGSGVFSIGILFRVAASLLIPIPTPCQISSSPIIYPLITPNLNSYGLPMP